MIARILLIVLGAGFCAPAFLGQRGSDSETFACRAYPFELDSFEKEPTVLSPDLAKRVQLRKDYTFAVWNGKRQLATFEYRDMNCCIEVGWSPDSTQFFLMYSDSGGYARFSVHWYTISGDAVSENHATKIVADEFASKYSCPARGPNNLFLLGWTRASSKAFLVTEVEPTGDCGTVAGHHQGYLVDAKSGNIVRRFGERQTDRIEKSCRATGAIPPSAVK